MRSRLNENRGLPWSDRKPVGERAHQVQDNQLRLGTLLSTCSVSFSNCSSRVFWLASKSPFQELPSACLAMLAIAVSYSPICPRLENHQSGNRRLARVDKVILILWFAIDHPVKRQAERFLR